MEYKDKPGHRYEGNTLSGGHNVLGDIINVTTDPYHPSFFRTSHYEAGKDSNPPRERNTCEWFLEHELFLHWRASSTNDLLWVTGVPGSGKSVLAKALIDERLITNSDLTTIVYFFFKDSDGQNTAAEALCSCIHQLLCADETLTKFRTVAIPLIQLEGESLQNNFQKLWKLFIAICQITTDSTIICVLDALDECRSDDRLILINALSNFYVAEAASGLGVKFLLTSRPYHDIQEGFFELCQNFPTIHLAAEIEAIAEEIDYVIAAKVADLGKMRQIHPATQRALEQRLRNVPNRTYLWLDLVWKEIVKSAAKADNHLRSKIETLPLTVEDAYEAILRRSPDHAEAQKILSCILGAGRALKVIEIDGLLAGLSLSEPSINILNETEGVERRKQSLLQSSGGFAVVARSEVFLLHQTAKEFLMKDYCKLDGSHTHTEGEPEWKHSLTSSEINLVLARGCVWYMLSIGHDIARKNQRSDGRSTRPKYGQHLEEQYPFLVYAARSWTSHYRVLASEQRKNLNSFVRELLNSRTWRSIGLRSWNFYPTECPDSGFSENLPDAVKLDMWEIVEMMIADRACLDAVNIEGKTALSIACEEGQIETMRLLTSHGADPNIIDGSGQTPLHIACFDSSVEGVQVLLRSGANPMTENAASEIPLQIATQRGDVELVRTFLENCPDIDAIKPKISRLLQYACERHKQRVVSVLAKFLGSPENPYLNALLAAVRRRNDKAGEQLLALAVDFSKEDADLGRLIWRKVEFGTAKEIKRWLTSDGQLAIRFREGQYSTAITTAVREDRTVILERLIDSAPDIYCGEEEFSKVLLIASFYGFTSSVEALIEIGDGFPHGLLYNHALLMALHRSHISVAVVLIKAGANVDRDLDQVSDSATKLWFLAAVRAGNLSMADRHLETSGNSLESLGDTAIWWATSSDEKWAKWMTMMLLVRVSSGFLHGSFSSQVDVLCTAASRGWRNVVSNLLDDEDALEIIEEKGKTKRTAWRCAVDDKQYRCAWIIAAKQVHLMMREDRLAVGRRHSKSLERLAAREGSAGQHPELHESLAVLKKSGRRSKFYERLAAVKKGFK